MAALTQAYKPKLAPIAFTNKNDRFVERLMPRRCMVVSVGLILAGLSVLVLMAVQWLPLSLLLGLAGFALIVTGGVLVLIFCGEL